MNYRSLLLLSLLSCKFFQAAEVFDAVASKNIRNVQKVLQKSFDIEVRNSLGQTALIFAAEKGSKAAVKALLKKGVEVNAVDIKGKTALDYAVEFGHKASVLCLVKHGAKVSTEDNLKSVQKVLRRRARIFMAVSCPLLGITTLTLISFLIPPSQPVCWCCALPLISLDAIIAGTGIGTFIPGVYWYRQAHKVQML